MKPVNLDYLARRRPSRSGWALLALGLVAGAISAERHHAWSLEAAHLEAESSELRHANRRAATRLREPGRDQAALVQEVRSANRVVEQLHIPWPQFFRDLEAASDASVALVAIQPDSGARSLRLDAEARDFESILAFVGRLEETPAFSVVHVASHQVKADSPARPVTFSLLASWGGEPK